MFEEPRGRLYLTQEQERPKDKVVLFSNSLYNVKIKIIQFIIITIIIYFKHPEGDRFTRQLVKCITYHTGFFNFKFEDY